MRRLVLALGLVLFPVGAAAQPAACVNGVAQQGLSAYLCNGVDLMARLPLSTFGAVSANEIWGWTDPLTGREIAMIGLSNGVGFVDVTVPTAPVVLGRLDTAVPDNTPAGGTPRTIWRTLRNEGSYLYVGSEISGHGVQVFDLTRLRTGTAAQVYTQDAWYRRVSNVHTLVTHNGYLYLAGSSSATNAVDPVCTTSGLHVVDIRTPLQPTYAGCYQGDGYTHEAQCLTYAGPDPDHAGKDLCFAYQGQEGTTAGAFAGEVAIVDMSNKAAPVRIAAGNYPAVGYSHQGWLTPDGTRLLINDEFDRSASGARTVVMNVTDLDSPEFEVNAYTGPATFAHNLYVVGRYVYLSNYTSGLRIADAARLAAGQASEVAFFDTYPQDNSYAYNGQWMNYPFFASGNVVAADIQNGLFVLRPTTLVTADEDGPVEAPTVSLSDASPNPTASLASLQLRVSTPERVRATLLDGTGREVAVLLDALVTDAASIDVDTRGLAAGVYVVRVVSPTFSAARRLSVVR